MKFIPKCSEKFQEGTRPLRETFGNFRGCENDEKCKKSPNGTPWGVIDKSVPGSSLNARSITIFHFKPSSMSKNHGRQTEAYKVGFWIESNFSKGLPYRSHSGSWISISAIFLLRSFVRSCTKILYRSFFLRINVMYLCPMPHMYERSKLPSTFLLISHEITAWKARCGTLTCGNKGTLFKKSSNTKMEEKWQWKRDHVIENI